jgi:hypothetical protein
MFFNPFVSICNNLKNIKKKRLHTIALVAGGVTFFSFIYMRYFRKSKKSIVAKPIEPKSVTELWEEIYEKNKKRYLETFKDKSTEKPNENIEPELYEVNWRKENNIDSNTSIEKKWKTNILMKVTPHGTNVILFYDVYKNGFAYYSNHAIKDKYLNALAMDYVIKFKCRDFFMDDEISPIPSPLIEVTREVEKIDEKKSEENKVSHRNIYSGQQQENDVFIKKKPVKKQESDKEDSNTKKQPLEEKKEVQYYRNRFIKMGRAEDFSFLPKKTQKTVFANHTVTGFDTIFDGEHDVQRQSMMSFADYKRFLEKNRVEEKDDNCEDLSLLQPL